jgi:hypothetical protein
MPAIQNDKQGFMPDIDPLDRDEAIARGGQDPVLRGVL